MQSKVMIGVTRILWELKLPPSLPVSRGSVPYQGRWWLKEKWWQLGTGLISELTSWKSCVTKLLFFAYSKKKGYNLREKFKKKKKQISYHFFFSFRAWVLFRNFALEPIRLLKFLGLGSLRWGLKTFGVQSLWREVIMSFSVAVDWIYSLPGQSLHFPGDCLSSL